jgi:HSP20 family protein
LRLSPHTHDAGPQRLTLAERRDVMTLMRHRQTGLDSPMLTIWPTWVDRAFTELPAWKDLTGDSLLKIEEFEADGKLTIRAEMPGLDPDKDVEITVAEGRLHLRAQRRSQTETDDKQGYRSEFQYGMFERTLRLPPGADEKDIKATYTDGILEVCIPIDATELEAKRIPITKT